LLDRRNLVVEQHQPDVVVGEDGGDLLGLARADAKGGVGSRTTDDDPLLGAQARGTGQRVELVERGVAADAAAKGDADEQAADGGRVRAQLSCASCWKLTGRPGTTVEIACL
jgi:hypothetical protein